MNDREQMSATEELDHIDRYFSKNWLDEDFPTDEIYAALDKLNKANARIAQFEEALKFYVETDETYEGGEWEDKNAFWLDGKRKAQKLLAESDNTWLSEHDKAVEQAFVKALRAFPSVGLSERQFGELKAIAESRK